MPPTTTGYSLIPVSYSYTLITNLTLSPPLSTLSTLQDQQQLADALSESETQLQCVSSELAGWQQASGGRRVTTGATAAAREAEAEAQLQVRGLEEE